MHSWWERSGTAPITGHLIRLEQNHLPATPGFLATCSCGWSAPHALPLAGAAGAEADRHLSEVVGAADE